MAYAVARTKLANLLIKAGYDKAKSLRAVKYPYIEAIQLRHIPSGGNLKSHKLYQGSKKNYIPVISEDGYVAVDDKDYGILGEKNKAKAFVEVTQERMDFLNSRGITVSGWVSLPLLLIAKYRHTYPKNIIIDSIVNIGELQFGFTSVAGFFGYQEGEIPLPRGKWLEVELPSDK